MHSLVFFGSSEFSTIVLEKVLSIKCEVLSVVTTPDKPIGRHLKLTPNPVKVLAQKHKIPVFTTIKDFLNTTPFSPPNLGGGVPKDGGGIGLVAAHGRRLGPKTLSKLSNQVYVIHPSLLPKYRGPSPLQQQILDGISETGVTLIQADLGEDTGPIVAQAKATITSDDTTASLGVKLFSLGAELFINFLGNSPLPFPSFSQREGPEVSYTRKFTRQDGFLPWEEFRKFDCERKFRAFFPWPGIWSTNPDGKRVKLIQIKPKIVVQEEGMSPIPVLQYFSTIVSS